MQNLRTASGRQLRSAGLIETPLPFAYSAPALPGARVLGDDGQIYESMKDWVSGEYTWKVRAQGEPGPALELQKSITHIQWRVEDSPQPWNDLVPLVDLLGPPGPVGPIGPQGEGLSFQGTVATVANLPTPSTIGYAYVVSATGDLWIYSGTAWNNAGPIQGPPGPIGPVGPTGPTGPAGAAVQLRKTTTEIQWRLTGETIWNTLVALDELKGPVGDVGPAGPAGPGFSYRGSVATVGALPTPSTTGYAFKVTATGDLYIFNGTAWVNAGPLQGPPGEDGADGAPGSTGPAGPQGASFSYRGEVATVGALPTPSTTGYAFKVTATGDLYIFNGAAWVNAGPLQGPQGIQGPAGATGLQGPAGPQGEPGDPADISISLSLPSSLFNVSGSPTTGSGGFAVTFANQTAGTVFAGPASGPAAPPGFRELTTGDVGLGTSSTPQFAGLGLGTAAVSGWELTVDGGVCQRRQSVTAVSSVYTLDVQTANEFVTAAAINGAVTITLSNLSTIPNGYVWRAPLSFQFNGGSVAWSTSGYTVKWDGGTPLVPTVGDLETVVITVVGGGTTIEIAPLKGRG